MYRLISKQYITYYDDNINRCAIFVCIIFHIQVEHIWPRIAKKKSDTFLFAGKALKATGTFHIMLRLLYFRMKMDQLYGEVRLML